MIFNNSTVDDRDYNFHPHIFKDGVVYVHGFNHGRLQTGVTKTNIEFKKTNTEFYDYESGEVLSNGITYSDYYQWYLIGGQVNDDYQIIYHKENNGTGIATYKTRLYDGKRWSIEHDIYFTGATPAGLLALYGGIKQKPNGDIYISGYSSHDNFIGVSQDGINFELSVVVNSYTDNYDEMAIQFSDQMNAIGVSRVTGSNSAMCEFSTNDGGVTWVNEGGLNIPECGGYVSPILNLVYRDGVPYYVLTYHIRQTVSYPHPNPNTIAVITKKVGAQDWSNVQYLVLDLNNRSGYQSVYFNKNSECILVYANETSSTECKIETKRVIISNNSDVNGAILLEL